MITDIILLCSLLVGPLSTTKVETALAALPLMLMMVLIAAVLITILDKLETHAIDGQIAANFLLVAVRKDVHKLLGSHEIRAIIQTIHALGRESCVGLLA